MEMNIILTNVTEEELQLKNRILELLKIYECERHINVNEHFEEILDNTLMNENSEKRYLSIGLSCDELKYKNRKPIPLNYRKVRKCLA